MVQRQPFNWQKSLALEENDNKVVGMWLCLRMWLFNLNSLTAFNPAIRVWGFSSGSPHARGPAWALSANECLFTTSLCEAQQNREHFPDAVYWSSLPLAALLGHGYCFTEGKAGSQLWKT